MYFEIVQEGVVKFKAKRLQRTSLTPVTGDLRGPPIVSWNTGMFTSMSAFFYCIDECIYTIIRQNSSFAILALTRRIRRNLQT
jgi:hypothetical protein